MNQKGGVGKTTIVVQTAATVADTMGGTPENTPVLGVSTDPQASMLEWANKASDALPFDFVQCHDDPQQLAKLKRLSQYAHIFVDTPGALDSPDSEHKLTILKKVLEIADDVTVPVEPEPMAFAPAARTIERVIKPSGTPFKVLINNWDPRDTEYDLDETKTYIDRRGYERYNTVIRHYKLHTRAYAGGVTVVSYPKNRTAMEARQDFFKFALEILALDGAAPRHALDGGGNAVTTQPGGGR